MRMLRDHVQHSYPPEAQQSRLTVASIQQLWNDWEIECLVLVSFSLQVFLFFFALFRKRYRSSALSLLLWLAYLSADTVAVFVLGRLTRVADDDPLFLFWAPFMLLHLGGQETITAFSMEDCALWKRHLLNLTTQVALAIYVVGKQWRGDRQLVAPMVLIFVSGTTKYVERIWRLGRAGSWAPGSRPWVTQPSFFSEEKPKFYIEEMAIDHFVTSMQFFMNITPKQYFRGWNQPHKDLEDIAREITSLDGAKLAYKLAEIQLSLIYDYLYTKFGSLNGVFHRLTILVLNSTALALFVVHHKGKGPSAAVKYYGLTDVSISYILLVGAVALEISSILIWIMSSYWPYKGCGREGRSPRIVLSILKHLRPRPESNRLEWSGKLPQYNLIDEIIQKRMVRAQYGWLKLMMLRMGIKQEGNNTIEHVVVSPEVKEVFFDKLHEIADGPHSDRRMHFRSLFHAEEYWATHKLQPSSSSAGIHAAQQAVSATFQGDMDIVPRALFWHLVTDICFLSDETPSKFRTCSQHLSNYIMHLLYRCNLMLDSDGRILVEEYTRMLREFCKKDDDSDKMNLIQRVRRDGREFIIHTSTREIGIRMNRLCLELLNSELAAADRWEMIATVWVELLCYIARNCDAGFHAKQLSAGGEFLTRAKMLMYLFVSL